MERARGFLGIAVLIFIAWLLSSDRRRFPVKTVIGGLVLQWALALIVLKTYAGRAFFEWLGGLVTVILQGADQGAAFVFGPLAGGDPRVTWSAVAGIKIMTTIIVVAALSALGYHYGIMQRVVRAMSWVMTRTLGVTGAESLSGAANVFLGQTEAPLFVRPLLPTMTRSELMAIMAGGFANISVGVMAYYVSILGVDSAGQPDPGKMAAVATHLLTASLMSVPASFITAKIMVPPGDEARPTHAEPPMPPVDTMNGLDAATTGAAEGMKLAINVLAMLIAFIALVAVVDAGLSAFGRWSPIAPLVAKLGMKQLDLTGILGLIFSPIAYLNGVEWADCRTFGGLLGKSMATNEMIAYGSLSEVIKTGGMSQRSIVMATYSLCGFANFSSIGIQIGGIGALAPSRRPDLVRLGARAMLAGAMATWMTGCIAGVLI
jgi:concentrative nucleoside transporter, CNT family